MNKSCDAFDQRDLKIHDRLRTTYIFQSFGVVIIETVYD